MSVITTIKNATVKVLGTDKKNAPVVSATARAAEDGLTELEVWHVPPNPHLLICRVPGEDGSNPLNLVSVQVRGNRNFLKKMRLRARRVKDKQFILEGPGPRGRGRW